MPRHHAIFPCSPESSDACVYKSGVYLEACLGAEIEFFKDTGAEGVYNDIDFSGPEEVMEEFD